jgi:hypothetical protein
MTQVYGRDSRYYRTAEVSRLDAAGRLLLVDDVRRARRIPGTFRHTLTANDRLDHLAQRYYGKPRSWWLIADANPEFVSPLTLLGQEPIVTFDLDVELLPGGHFSTVLRALRDLAGVEDVLLRGEPGAGRATLTVRLNRATQPPTTLLAVVCPLAAHVGIPRPVSRLGRTIVIPPPEPS